MTWTRIPLSASTRDHAHFAAYSAARTAGMHQDQAHDLATDIDALVTAVLAGGDDAAGGV
jgi:hypothetical protein